jgi:hypothetical protein
MSVVPCEKDGKLQILIKDYSEALKIEAHKLGVHGLSESEFYNSGLFRGAIERVRGQFSATMGEKREFVKHVLNYMEDQKFILNWESSGDSNRHDYKVTLPTGKVAAIELKGCLDGNNTNIFERPPHAQEFIIWSVCSNTAADPRKNVWSGIHTRLGAEIIAESKRVDGIVVWDMVCGTIGRPCPKLTLNPSRITVVGPYRLPPPCIYVFPATVPSPRNNPEPQAQSVHDVQILRAFNDCFGGMPEEVNSVTFQVANRGSDIVRSTKVMRGGIAVKESSLTAIQRS